MYLWSGKNWLNFGDRPFLLVALDLGVFERFFNVAKRVISTVWLEFQENFFIDLSLDKEVSSRFLEVVPIWTADLERICLKGDLRCPVLLLLL